MKKLCVLLVVILFLGLSVYNSICFYRLTFNSRDGYNSVLVDTTINRLRIDSIELVITRQDSVIYQIKYNADEEIKQAIADSTYNAVSKFLELVNDTSLYGGSYR